MKRIALFIITAAVALGCNTKMGSNEPTNDSELNPAEMPVDSVGKNAEADNSADIDSNRAGEPMNTPGKSDLQVGGDDGSEKAISSDGNYVEEDKNK